MSSVGRGFEEPRQGQDFRLVVDTIPGLVWSTRPDGSAEFFNQRWLEYTGLSPEQALNWGWKVAIHPDDLPRMLEIFHEALNLGRPFEVEGRFRRWDGEFRWFLFRGSPLLDGSGKVVQWFGTNTDLEDRKRTEDLAAGEKRLLEMVTSGHSMPGILEALCQFVESMTSGCYCSVVLVDPSGTRLEHGAAPSLPGSFITSIIGRPVNAESGPCAMAAYLNEQVIAADLTMETRWAEYEWCPMALAHGVQACWSTPIMSAAGEVLGAFAIYYLEPRTPTPQDRALIDQFTHIASISVERQRSQEALRSAFAEIKILKDQLAKENIALREEIDKASMFEEIVGTSRALHSVLSRLAKVAPTDSTVLITGETGTGKELVARAIHKRSHRSARAFVGVNCAAIPHDLIASELFGHEKGAFTGATQQRLGRFELAGGGTIFLDEVGDLPAETQIALLRVLQEHEFERVGGAKSIRTDVRVIAATNRDLQAAIAGGTFRRDLYYRLNVFPIDVPSLRERREDIPVLVEYFIHRYARKAGKSIRGMNAKSLELLQSYAWPGNIRELQNVIERSVIVCDTETFSIDESWLSRQPPATEQGIRTELSQKLASQEKEMIEAALRESGGRVSGPSGAAAKLGIPGSTLDSKIRSLKINKNHFKTTDPSTDRR
jgi:formate hydrogenlyase transcriptional activator